MHVYSVYSANPQTSRAYRAFVKDDSEHLKRLFFINMLNEDVHVRGVSGVILFRETESLIICNRQIGRALTTGVQSKLLILDVVNNFGGLSSYGTIQSDMARPCCAFAARDAQRRSWRRSSRPFPIIRNMGI